MIQDKPRPNRPIHRTLTISAKTRTVARIGCSATLRKLDRSRSRSERRQQTGTGAPVRRLRRLLVGPPIQPQRPTPTREAGNAD
jgi:hypothetical protein